jgi:hypothetical protein
MAVILHSLVFGSNYFVLISLMLLMAASRKDTNCLEHLHPEQEIGLDNCFGSISTAFQKPLKLVLGGAKLEPWYIYIYRERERERERVVGTGARIKELTKLV